MSEPRKFNLFGNRTPEQIRNWMEKMTDEHEPPACKWCGAIAGACGAYPNCPNGPMVPKDEKK